MRVLGRLVGSRRLFPECERRWVEGHSILVGKKPTDKLQYPTICVYYSYGSNVDFLIQNYKPSYSNQLETIS